MKVEECVKRFDGLIASGWCDLYRDFINRQSVGPLGVGSGTIKENVRNVQGFLYAPSNLQKINENTKEEKIKSIPSILISNTIYTQLLVPLLNYQTIFKHLYPVKLNQIDFLKYEVGGKYEIHVDQGPYSVNRTLTVIVNLNEDYEGGEFEFYNPINGRDKIREEKLKKGSVLIFPSNFMYPHSVRPITKGERYSLVCWLA